MRWKIAFAVFFAAALTAVAAVAWYQWDQYRRQEEVANKLRLCQSYIRMERHQEAQQLLEEVLDQNPSIEGADSILATLAESYEATPGREADARQCWERIRDQYPGSNHIDRALAAVAEYHFQAGELDKAEELWDLLLGNYAQSDARDDALFGKARLIVAREGAMAARGALQDLVEQFPDSNIRNRAEDLLGEINLEMLYSPELGDGDVIHSIEQGETLHGLSRRFKVSVDLLMRVNKITDPRRLSIGKRLKIPKVDFSIVVDKTHNTLTLHNEGKFFKRYAVRTGRQDWRTPAGEFHIRRKVKDPSWTNLEEGRIYPPGDPGNELGTRWMAFEGSRLGIHGTVDPSTIGTYASNGCVGMLKEDVEELYDLVPVGTPVKIIGKMSESDNNE